MKTARLLLVVVALLPWGCGAAEYPSATTSRMSQTAPAALPASAAPDQAAKDNAVPTNLQRKLVYTADIQVVVDDFEPIPTKVLELLKPLDAVVAHSSLSGSAGSPRSGEWTIRVPVAHYQDLLAALRQIGELRNLRADSQDVTEEYYDVEARIHNKKEEESRLLKLLDQSTANLKDVLEIERELSRVREEVERMEGRMRVLQDITALSTVTLHVEEIKNFVPEKMPTFATQARRTFTSSLSALGAAAQTLALSAIALSPWAGVLVVVGTPVWGVLRFRRRRKSPGNPFGS